MAAEILLLPVSKYKRPPYWSSTSDFDLDQFAVICMLFCIRTPNVVQIGALTAEIWRHICFSRWRPRPLNTTSSFVFVDVTAFRRSKSISKPNFVEISPLAAEVLLLPISKYKRPPYWNSTSSFDLDQFAVICMLFCIRLPNSVNRNIRRWNMTSYPFLKMAVAIAKHYFRFRICWYHCLQKVKVYQQTKFRRDISIGGWDITISGFEIKTSAMLEFYFRFRSRPFRRNRRVILHQAAEFRPNRNIRRWNMTSYRFSRWRPSAMLYLLWGNGGPPTKCLSGSEFRPEIATSSD